MGKMAESVSHRSTTTGFERLTLQSRRSATGARAKTEARLVKYLISIRDILLHWMDNSIGDTEKVNCFVRDVCEEVSDNITERPAKISSFNSPVARPCRCLSICKR